MTQWTGPATKVTAQRTTFNPRRPLDAGGPLVENPYPDAVAVLAETTSGAVTLNLLNYAANFGDTRMELYGSAGTLVYRSKGDSILGAQTGDAELKPLPIPAEHDRPWRAEQEFVRLVQGEIQESSFTFADGVRNMEYLEAAYYAATEGRAVTLP
jgi:predicted dehydrogenase